MISYSYLWAHEAAEGQEEGLKNRPVLVVLARIVENGLTRMIVAPITHAQPPAGEGIELPSAVKRNLRLDEDRSWIVTTEVNQFIWPGPDIGIAKDAASPLYGAIPARLFERTKQQISDNARVQRAAVTKRTE